MPVGSCTTTTTQSFLSLQVRSGSGAINLAALTRPSYEAVRKRLLEGGLIDPGLMRKILEGWGKKYTNGHAICLHYPEQLFPAQLSSESHPRIFTPHTIGTVRLRFRTPYSGCVLLRFERSTMPENAGTRTVVLRVLKTLEPVKAVIPAHNMRIPEPKEPGRLAPNAPRPRPCWLVLVALTPQHTRGPPSSVRVVAFSFAAVL
ncbi:hypothetical protein LshimejAT787_0505880 [Lyophyllum shimeji]|uniref:Uncharacterized protein n=1 Tax=Lyophyllum shimeji TaxID=47721 RepID=A0A9P3UMJ6_LYOSH|nr:hypothetical protein LshimejAT787_0505880 [Lyophyllum shimeji]